MFIVTDDFEKKETPEPIVEVPGEKEVVEESSLDAKILDPYKVPLIDKIKGKFTTTTTVKKISIFL